jgi:alcohol dehydrogenase class IV
VTRLKFEFATAARIAFGAGAVSEVATAAKTMGRRALLVTGRSQKPGIEGIQCVTFIVQGEPTVELVRRGVLAAKEERCDLVIGFGGGSAIDAGKAIAAMLTNSGEPLDYLEVIGKGQVLAEPSAPFIAVPTTAGTGAEVTRNAVLTSEEHKFKASLRSPFMLPRLAVVDPELTYDLPPSITAATGLDALTQLIEPYVSIRANAMTDLYCLEGIGRIARALVRAWKDGRDTEARADMALASLLGGLSLANAGLGAAHGFAAPVGGTFSAPHGAVCAALLPHAMTINIRALRSRAPESDSLRRYETIARLLTGNSHASAEKSSDWVAGVCHQLKIPPLGFYGIASRDVESLALNAAKASSMKANPIPLTHDELRELVTRAL